LVPQLNKQEHQLNKNKSTNPEDDKRQNTFTTSLGTGSCIWGVGGVAREAGFVGLLTDPELRTAGYRE